MAEEVNAAEVMSLGDAGWDLAIREVGRFSVPRELLRGRTLLPSALEVVSVAMGQGDTYILESAGGVVTTELLAEGVRLRIQPKVGFDALETLVEWSQHDPTLVPGPRVLVNARPEGNLYDFLASRLLTAIEGVFRGGWLLRVEPQTLVLEDVRGELDPLATYEYVYGRQELRFVQSVLVPDHEALPNRVLVTALGVVAQAGERLAPDLLDRAREMLGAAPVVTTYRSAGEALEVCEELLGRARLDASRAYYYPALNAAELLLRGVRRAEGAGALIEDVPLRIDMPNVFEGAVRNVAAAALQRQFRVSKESAERLYRPGAPTDFDPQLEPDLVIRPLGTQGGCAAIIDAKYKERPAAGDHYQLAAYAQVYGAPLAGFVSVTEKPWDEGERRLARSRRDVDVFEYSLYAGDIAGSLGRFGTWLQGRL